MHIIRKYMEIQNIVPTLEANGQDWRLMFKTYFNSKNKQTLKVETIEKNIFNS